MTWRPVLIHVEEAVPAVAEAGFATVFDFIFTRRNGLLCAAGRRVGDVLVDVCFARLA
jgi:hypothetical protein